MKPRNLLALLAGASLLSLPLSAQSFYGSDDFNDNSFASGRWSPFSTANGGLWTETNGRLEFTADASSTAIVSSNRAQQFRTWSNTNSGNSSYTDSWSATVSATLDNAVVASNGVQIIGLESFMAGGPSGYYGIYLMYTTSGGRAFSEQGLYNGSTFARSTVGSSGALTPGFDTSDVLLQLNYDGTTRTFTSGYSVDGGATFINYGTGAPSSTSGWFTAPTTGFGLQIYGTIYGNGSSAGPIATSGQMYADNLAVSAIPEPSTYAALAGFGALGLVLWRRRQAKASL